MEQRSTIPVPRRKFQKEWFWLAFVLSIFLPVFGLGYGLFKLMPGWRQDKQLGTGCLIGTAIGAVAYVIARFGLFSQ